MKPGASVAILPPDRSGNNTRIMTDATAGNTGDGGAACAPGGAQQPAKKGMSLALLNANSAKLGKWHVQICNPHIYDFSYGKYGEKKMGKNSNVIW